MGRFGMKQESPSFSCGECQLEGQLNRQLEAIKEDLQEIKQDIKDLR